MRFLPVRDAFAIIVTEERLFPLQGFGCFKMISLMTIFASLSWMEELSKS